MVRAEGEVEIRREVRKVVPRLARVVPVMELRRTEQPLQRPERHARVGVDEDRPTGTKHGDPGEELAVDAEHDGREVHARRRRDAVERVLSMRGHPVELLRGVVHGVETPENVEPMTRAVEPID